MILRLFASFLKLGFTAFGGPTAIAYVREYVVDRKEWVDEKDFNNGVALAQIIPGATVMQIVAYVGLCIRGFLGALSAFVAYAFPSYLMMLVLTIIYVYAKSAPQTIPIFEALRIFVVSLAANGTINFGRRNVKKPFDVAIVILSALLFLLKFSPFAVIFTAVLIGLSVYLLNPRGSFELRIARDKLYLYKYVFCLLAIVLSFNVLLYSIDPGLFLLSTLMMKVDVMAFGGGYGSVPFMLHEVVDVHRLMDSKTFMDGIALGQITPGPIVITATFVGYLIKGFAGSVVATLSVFTPSFLILLSVVPVFESIKENPAFKSIFHVILVSFVGLMVAVTVRFALAVEWSLPAMVLGVISFLLLRRFNVLIVIALSLILGYLIL